LGGYSTVFQELYRTIWSFLAQLLHPNNAIWLFPLLSSWDI
jgi:hypothetical protein